jgi:hypothetical protein
VRPCLENKQKNEAFPSVTSNTKGHFLVIFLRINFATVVNLKIIASSRLGPKIFKILFKEEWV